MCAPIFMKPRRHFARLNTTGERVERIAITRNGQVEVLTADGTTLYVNATELTNEKETNNGDR
jgi:hypothetical protein